MRTFNQNDFDEFIIDNEIIQILEKPRSLKSKRLSNFYVNWRNASNNPFTIDKLSDYVLSFSEQNEIYPECFYGVPEGATKLAVITQYKFAKMSPDFKTGIFVLPMGRGKPKTGHGDPKDEYFIGYPYGKTNIIEDTATTGGSLIEAIKNVDKLEDASIIAAIVLTDRNENNDKGESVMESVEKIGIPYYAMSNAVDLLPKLCKKRNFSEKTMEALKNEFVEYSSLNLLLD